MDSSNFKKEEYVGIQWPKKELGRTGLLVAPICWGCAPLGDIPEVLGYRVAEEEAPDGISALTIMVLLDDLAMSKSPVASSPVV